MTIIIHKSTFLYSASKQYPYPSRVTIFLPYMPIFFLNLVMFTSIVRSKTYTSSLHILPKISSLENTLPLFWSNRNKISNSFLVREISLSSILTFFLVMSSTNDSCIIRSGTCYVSIVAVLLNTALIRAITSLSENGFEI